MANALKAARLQYLENASSNLSTASPAISAHLQMTCRSLTSDSDLNTIHQPIGHPCPACGNILIPGWSCEAVAKTSGKRTRRDRVAAAESSVKVQQVRCNKCARVTAVESKRVGRRERAGRERRDGALEVGSTVDRVADKGEEGNFVQQSERKRKPGAAARRNQRGKKESLLSMLEKQKKAESSAGGGLGLDLMDFIKH